MKKRRLRHQTLRIRTKIPTSTNQISLLHEPLSEDQDSVSYHNYVNATTELNNEDDIKPSANHKEVSYFIIFECGRNLLDKLNPYQRAFAASKKTSRGARIAYRNRVKEENPDIIPSAF